jgi:hypothetical protein
MNATVKRSGRGRFFKAVLAAVLLSIAAVFLITKGALGGASATASETPSQVYAATEAREITIDSNKPDPAPPASKDQRITRAGAEYR